MMKKHAARSRSMQSKQFASATLALIARSSSFPSARKLLNEILRASSSKNFLRICDYLAQICGKIGFLCVSVLSLQFAFIRVHSRLNLFVCAETGLPTSKPIRASFLGERPYSYENCSHCPAFYSCASEKVRRDRVVLSRSCPGPERKRHKGNFVCERRINRSG